MDLRKLLKYKGKSIAWLAKEACVPYATAYNIVTGKTDILKVQFGTVLRISGVLKISMYKLFEFCILPGKHYTVFLQDDEFYMSYHYGREIRTIKLCENTPLNAKYIDKIAKLTYYEEMLYHEEDPEDDYQDLTWYGFLASKE